MELKNSNVVFIPDGHRYLLGNMDLQGITSTLIPAIFGDYTKDIPQDVLERAAQRGTHIHQSIAMMEEGFNYEGYEVNEYKRLRDELGLIPVRSEYTVTDGKHFASQIDKVYEGDIIADIKTTAEIHYAEVAFQLSWYATYYQALNKRKVTKAYVIWLPKPQYGTCQIIEIPLATCATIKSIVAAYLRGEDVTKYASTFRPHLPAKAHNIIAKIKAKELMMARQKEEIDNMKKVLIDAFNIMGIKKFESEDISITRIDATTRTTIDTKRLKAELPLVYDQYSRVSKVSATVKIILK